MLLLAQLLELLRPLFIAATEAIESGNGAKFGLSKPVITVGVAGSKDRTDQVCADFWILLVVHLDRGRTWRSGGSCPNRRRFLPAVRTVPSPFNRSRLEALLLFLGLLHLLHFLFALLCLLRALGALEALAITLRISLHRRHVFLLLLALRGFFRALLALLARLRGNLQRWRFTWQGGRFHRLRRLHEFRCGYTFLMEGIRCRQWCSAHCLWLKLLLLRQLLHRQLLQLLGNLLRLLR
mmetsp:Transcript_25699/g.56238  ORF Transcript_25699/g.56238 Transcript_25699/m.56238 type:complete len:238 (-) Transcript_25699:409-1122(-)